MTTSENVAFALPGAPSRGARRCGVETPRDVDAPLRDASARTFLCLSTENMGSQSRTQRAQRRRPKKSAARKLREKSAASGDTMTERELKQAASSSRISRGAASGYISGRKFSESLTAPVGRTRSTTRDARGRFEQTRWLRFVKKGDDVLAQEHVDRLVDAVKQKIAQGGRRTSCTLVEKELRSEQQRAAFREAAALAINLVNSDNKSKQVEGYKTCFANHVCGKQKTAAKSHTDQNLRGTVVMLLQASGPGLSVQKTGSVDDAQEFIDVKQEVGQPVYLAANVPHVVPFEKRNKPRISLVFFF